jgi:cellulose synthase/poly-beta-1,6-N-acetylglucosamine synthase-like glycosyltransferase
MSWAWIILLAVALLVVGIQSFLLFFLLFRTRHPQPQTPEVLPFLSILVAARNEEANLSRCLAALTQVDYPHDRYEILVGNDDSEDQTLAIMHEWQQQFPQLIRVWDLRQPQGAGPVGKAGILASLAQVAKGDLFLMADADMAPQKDWCKAMVRAQAGRHAIVTGFTLVEGGGFQMVDWTFAQVILKVLSDMDRPITSMGNNMLVTKAAYSQVGGYETIPFSITEDFALFRAIYISGGTHFHAFERGGCSVTLPISSFKGLILQRTRWLHGALQAPFWTVFGLGLQALWYPTILALLCFNLGLGLCLLALKMVIQALLVMITTIKVRAKVRPYALIFFEFYSLVLSITTVFSYFVTRKTQWKGRTYRI